MQRRNGHNTLSRLAVLATTLAALACRGHDPYGEAATLADDGACEQAGSAISRPGALPVTLTTLEAPGGGLRLISAGGVVLGLPACTGSSERPSSACTDDEVDLTSVSRAVRHVATCYEARGDAASLVKAFAQLQQIVESPLYLRSSQGEQERIDAQLDRVETRLGRLDPDYRRAVEAKSRELDSAKATLEPR